MAQAAPAIPIQSNQLPETGFVRLPQILAVLPIGKSTFWRWVANGKVSRGVKLGPRTTAWKVEEIRQLMDSFNDNSEG
jgi:predicted DNA-binding transcriptional regulator AlpA